MKRIRSRNNRGSGGGSNGGGGGGGGGGAPMRSHTGNVPLNRNHVFDSSGPDLRVRGTAQQLFERYLQLGRDATGSLDRVMAESYFQHADHYFRILTAMNQAAAQQQYQQNQHQGQQNGQISHQYQPRREQEEQGQEDGASGMGDQPSAEMREIPIMSGEN